MFTWICPQCGREVLPSYTECPNCAPKTAAGAPAAPPPGPPQQQPPYQPPQPQQPAYQQQPQQPAYQPPPEQPPQQPAYQQPVYQQPPQQPVYQQPAQQQAYQRQYAPRPAGVFSGMPTWLLTVVFALAMFGLVAGVYWLVGSTHSSAQTSGTPPPTVESPAAKPGAKTNPLQKYVEISGVRFTENAAKKLMVKFMVTNHSDSDLSGLTGNVTIWGRTQKSEEDAVGTFSFAGNVGPQASQELSAPLTTKLKIYELPDWQNVTTDLQITAPQ